MKVIQKLHKEHISNLNSPPDGSSEQHAVFIISTLLDTRVDY